MKEIHAYLNDDGSYHIEGIETIYDTEKFIDARIEISKAKITIVPMADAEKRYMVITIPEEER